MNWGEIALAGRRRDRPGYVVAPEGGAEGVREEGGERRRSRRDCTMTL